jgi:hypothetical protein
VPLRREEAERDERGLARHRYSERLEHHGQEQQRQAVMDEEVVTAASVGAR